MVIDGASYFQLLRFVLFPAIRPTITLMTIIWSFLAFDFVYVLTQGGLAYASEVLSTLSYRYAFYNYTIGPAAAVALVISSLKKSTKIVANPFALPKVKPR